MGLLLETRSGRLVAMSPHTVIGRSPACTIVLDDRRASAEHAAITWSSERWEVRDLGSLNGTWLGGRRLATGERAPVRANARLMFGGSDAWLLTDDRAAGPAARNESNGEIVHSTTGLLALPSASDPQAMIYRGADGRWLVQLGTEQSTIPDRAQLDLAGARWFLFLPTELGPMPTTLKAHGFPLALADISLWFAPSLDEEHVDIRVRTDDGKDWLLPPRSSHYMLLTLARIRLEDAHSGVGPEEQGWIYASRLADMLHYTPERLNVEVFRARALFAKLGLGDHARVVERRAVNRQLRIGVIRLHVTRG